jgi:hypothetical protein
VLTDYNHLADFVPDMRSCRIVSAPGMPLQVEQKSETGFLIWRFPIEVVLRIEEQPQQFITSKTIWGNVKNTQGEWRIRRSARETQLEYSAAMELDFWVPPIIGAAIIRRDVRDS